MRRAALLFFSILAGCSRAPPPSPPPALAPSALASSSALASAPAWPSALPIPTLPSRGPITVTGYPTDLRTCLPDPAENAGFTKDGAELGYCMHGRITRCELLDRSGRTRSLSSQKNADIPAGDPAKERAIAAFIKDSGLPALGRRDCTLRPPPLAGSWAYPDIVVSVARIDSSFTKGASGAEDKLLSQPLVKIGGAVDGEPPAYPLTYSAPHRVMSPATLGDIPFNVTELNALVLAPDGTELGIVVHANCMEWCDDFEIARLPAARFASLVYNDTGFRALEKGKLERAVELFTRAAYVDPSRELPAYNLACAYARLKDGRAEAALDLAIGRGGDAVRARAVKDKDFESVRSAPWFVKLTSR